MARGISQPKRMQAWRMSKVPAIRPPLRIGQRALREVSIMSFFFLRWNDDQGVLRLEEAKSPEGTLNYSESC